LIDKPVSGKLMGKAGVKELKRVYKGKILIG